MDIYYEKIKAINGDRKQSHQLRVKIEEEAFGGLKGKKVRNRISG